MLISEDYVVKFLLQETQASHIRWAQNEDGSGYWAGVNGVKVFLGSSHTLEGPRLFLKLEHDDETANILEPNKQGLLRQRYRDTIDDQIASDLTNLVQEVQYQLARSETFRDSTSARQSIYRRLLFADGAADPD